MLIKKHLCWQGPCHIVFTMIAIFLALALANTGCDRIVAQKERVKPAANNLKVLKMSNGSAPVSDQGVPDLPYSFGKRFQSLDAYLAHLERYAGPVDAPWWRETRPGVYEHVIRMTGAKHETATREELERRFGFRR